MSWKFNPPPGWPAQPEGWQPPPGWAPDPSWPPAPRDWQFWVPATSTPEPAPPASPAPTVHDAPTSLANPTVPSRLAGAGPDAPGHAAQPGGAGQGGPASGAGSYEPAPPYPPGAPQSSALAQPPPSYQPAGGPSYPSPGAYPPPGAHPTPGTYPPPGSYPPPGTPAGGAAWYQRWWAVGGAALTVLLVGCVAGGAVAVLTDSDGDPRANPPANTAPPATGDPQPTQSPGPGGGEGLGPGEEESGEGPTIIPLDLPEGSLHTVTMEWSGAGFFSSALVDEAGEVIINLGSTELDQDEYSGTWPLELGLFGSGPAAAIDITFAEDGTWTVRIQDISEAPLWPEVTEGTGDSVLRIDPNAVDDSVTPHATHDGGSNFIVWAYSPGEDFNDQLLFNLIGEVDDDAERAFTPDQTVLHVQADGNWTLTPP